MFLLAFGESLAFISLLVPAWGALVGIGALIGASGISFYPVWIAGGLGAALGDWVSYWFGFRYKERVAQMWPLSRYPDLLPKGETARWFILNSIRQNVAAGRLGKVKPRAVARFLRSLPTEGQLTLLTDLVEQWGALGADKAMLDLLRTVTKQ